MSTQIRKRALFSQGARGTARYWCIGIVGAARFDRYPFQASLSGDGRSRTMSDRLADIKNMRDLVPLEMVKPTTRGVI